jgi:eukaryotic-like serine/threonine-protein kinase
MSGNSGGAFSRSIQPAGKSRPTGVELAIPVRKLSSGPDGMAMLARGPVNGEPVEQRYAHVASSDPARWQQILKSAKRYALIDHPGFRRLLFCDETAEVPVLTFEGFLERNLHSRLAHRGLRPEEAWQLLLRLAPALAAAHRLGLVHGHLTPSHVLLHDDGSPMLDFPWLDVSPRRTGRFDAECQPPQAEVDEGPLDERSDVYALGALLKVSLSAAITDHRDLTQGPLTALIRKLMRPERDLRPSMTEVCFLLDSSEVTNVGGETRSIPPGVLGTEFPLPAAPTQRLHQGSQLGRFEIEYKLGEGGMGEVYRALDRANGQRVALKVLHLKNQNDPTVWSRFRKEARILAQIRSPYIANLIEANRDQGMEFIALEFVDGINLQQWLDKRGRCSEHEALAILTDVARGLSEAHVRGIVHRDIKPDNVMIAQSELPPLAAAAGTLSEPKLGQVKLCDFGIARSLTQRDGTMAFTEHGVVLGTPAFMAPEQCRGDELNPATDIYALGVVLFQLISGQLPFEEHEPTLLMFAHVTKAPPILSDVVPDVSIATSKLVARMLAKDPPDRFIDAAALLEALERTANGTSSSVEVHPALPVTDAKRIVRHVFEWDLKASARALWPFVSNTDRLNHAIGLPPAEFIHKLGADGIETEASSRVAGVALRWREHAFEWIESKRWSVLRVFTAGVMVWYIVELSLQTLPNGGTKLRYSMTLEPRHWLGRLIVSLQQRLVQRRALGRAFERIDRYASAEVMQAPGSDAFQAPARLAEPQRWALDSALLALRKLGIEEPMLEALGAFCAYAPDQELTALRPIAFARKHNLDPDRFVDACLQGAQYGLLTLLWQVLCPLCRIPTNFASSLRAVAEHANCPTCNVQFPIDFVQSLELVFRVAEAIRETELRTYCVGGPAFAPHVAAQLRLAAHERLDLELALEAGGYKIRSPQLPYDFPLQVSDAAHSSRGWAILRPEPPVDQARILVLPRLQSLHVTNLLDHEIVLRVERVAPREDALTAARAVCLASFRALFPTESLANGRLASVGRAAFLVARIYEQRELLRRLGDARTFEHVVDYLAILSECVAAEGGAVIRTTSGTSLCAFEAPAAALRAGLALLERETELAVTRPASHTTLDIRLLVHQGSAVATTIDGRLDYFGDTVETALELIDRAPQGQLLLSAAVVEDQRVLADATAAGHAFEPMPTTEAANDLGFVMVPKLERTRTA